MVASTLLKERDLSALCRVGTLHDVYLGLSIQSLKELCKDCSSSCRFYMNEAKSPPCNFKFAISLLNDSVQAGLFSEEELKTYLSNFFND